MSQEAAQSTGGARRRRSRRREPAPRVEPGTEIGSYTLERRLGAGSFGTVYLARRSEQRYAVKLVSLKEVGEWGVREVVALSRVSHPNVAGLRGFWRWPDSAPRFLVVVMRYVHGRQLDEWAQEENPSPLRVLELVLGLARGLEAVHRAGVVHLDVKPANILVGQEDGQPVLVDFGVSGWEDNSEMTGYAVPPGTLSHRSPESWRFQQQRDKPPGALYRPTPADDMYALGVVLYFLLTDRVPFDVELESARPVVTQPPVPPHERNARVPLELSQLCLSLLDKQPQTRLGASALQQQAGPLLAQRGALWESPLFEAYSVHNETTRPGPHADETHVWLESQRQRQLRPRRGKRPPRHEADSAWTEPEPAPSGARVEPQAAPFASPVAPGPALSMVEREEANSPGAAPLLASAGQALGQPSLRPSVQSARGRPAPNRRTAIWAGLGLTAIAGVLGLLLSLRASRPATPSPPAMPPAGWAPALPTWQSGWKVAPPLKPPEAEPLAPTLAPEKEEASVNRPPQHKPQRLKAAKQAAVLGCATLTACASPQLLPAAPPPEPRPCPAGAVEAMAKFGIEVGDRDDATFKLSRKEDDSWIQVRPGWTQVRTMGWEDMPADTLLGGELIVAERVYVRFTQARTPDGKTFPVCFELYENGGPRGNDLREGTQGPTAEMFTNVDIKAVSGFK